MKDSEKTDRTPVVNNQNGGQKPRRGRPPTNKGSRNNSSSRPSSPALPGILSPNKFNVLSSNDDTDIEPWTCENCKKSFSNPDAKMLECQRCRVHYCIKCLNKSDEEYKILSKSDSMWFCGPCKSIIERNIVTDLKIEERCNEIVRDFEMRLASIESDLRTKCNESDVRKIVQDELKIQNETKSQTAVESNATAPENTVTEVISEINERNSRKNNLVLYGIEEKNSENREERIEHDTEIVREIAKECGIELDSYPIGKIVRLGKYSKEKNKRPMLVRCETPNLKIDILRNAHKLKGEEQEKKFKEITLSHDMTKTEREEERKMFVEAKNLTKKSQGKEVYKVRGPPGNRRVVPVNENK